MSESIDLLDRKSAAALLKISDRTLDRLPDLPRVRLSARRVVYRRADLERYIEKRLEAATAV